MTSFGSDNHAGVHPRVFEYLHQVNSGSAAAYGGDRWTTLVQDRFRDLFGAVETFLTLNGTGTNVLALRSVLKPWEGVIAPQSAHINTDETGAPEAAGIKILPVPTTDGKLRPEHIEPFLSALGNPHHVQPRVVSLSQTTEWGTVYTLEELRAVAEKAHRHGLLVHLDGARLANGVAALECSPRDMVQGVDILSFGGTKNGALGAEALVFLTPGLNSGVEYLRKQHLQLASKMRYVAAQFLALFDQDLWLENARNANRQAAELARGLQGLEGVALSAPVEANAVFVTLPKKTGDELQKEFPFYWWNESLAQARWMTSWSTADHEVKAFLQRLRDLL